jgi:hypothetical protein
MLRWPTESCGVTLKDVDDDEEPTAEVLVDREWYPAEILSWSGTAGALWANVRWWQAPGPGQLGTFPEAEVREHK